MINIQLDMTNESQEAHFATQTMTRYTGISQLIWEIISFVKLLYNQEWPSSTIWHQQGGGSGGLALFSQMVGKFGVSFQSHELQNFL